MQARDVVLVAAGVLLGWLCSWLWLRGRISMLRSTVARLTMHYRHARTRRSVPVGPCPSCLGGCVLSCVDGDDRRCPECRGLGTAPTADGVGARIRAANDRYLRRMEDLR